MYIGGLTSLNCRGLGCHDTIQDYKSSMPEAAAVEIVLAYGRGFGTEDL